MKIAKVEHFVLSPQPDVAPFAGFDGAESVLKDPRCRFFHAISSFCSVLKNRTVPPELF